MTNIFYLLGLVVAITIHEFAHAYTADQLGDPTPRSYGRLSLNPLVHLDPLGTLMLFIARFGWGKPVPIDPYNLKNPKKDELLIAAAGPLSNILLSLFLSLFLRLSPAFSFVIIPLIVVNISLAVFNLIPIPPLDGSKIFLNLLPVDTAAKWENELTSYGPFLLILLFFLPINGSNLIVLIVSPIVNLFLRLLV